MSITNFFSPKKTSLNFYLILLLSFLMIKSQSTRDPFANLESCLDEPYLSNEYCFNTNIFFDSKIYQINNFAKNENGDLMLQISEQTKYGIKSTSRLFYGLTNEGKYLFKNESSYSNEFNINIDEDTFDNNDFYHINPIKDSKNLFVTIKNTPNKENKYLFSINSYNSMVELYDLNNDNNNYIIWSFHKFFNLNSDHYNFPFDYELFEIKDRNEYVIVFIPKIIIEERILNANFMKKFRFQSFDVNAFEERSLATYNDYLDTKILNVFLMDDLNTLVVLYVNKTIYEEENQGGADIRGGGGNVFYRILNNDKKRKIASADPNYPYNPMNNGYIFKLKFYNSNLKPLYYIKDVELEIELIEFYQGEDLFVKSLYMNIFGEQLVIYVYSIRNGNFFLFDMFDVNYQEFKGEISPIREYFYDGFGYNTYFDIDYSPNDFIKVRDTQVAFIYISRDYNNNPKLVIILLDLDILFDIEFYGRNFVIDLENYSPTYIKGFSYNNYLSFASTGGISKNNYGYYNNQNYAQYLSMFMIFGYGNGTDCNIDISKFLFKDEYNKDNNFFWFLFQNLTMENNIFGYYPFGIIKLAHIPDEISIYQYNIDTKEEIPLEDSFIGSDCITDNNNYKQDDCLAHDYILKQNESLIKTSEYYYIDYQYVLVDKDLMNELYGGIGNVDDDYGGGNIASLSRRLQDKLHMTVEFDPFFPIYLGRVNRIQFKLCHEYCETCYVLDKSKDNHKCLSCLPEYQYDYLYFTNQKEKNPDTCVLEGYYYDTEKEDVSLCSEIEYKYYINTTKNKKIVFQIKKKMNVLLHIRFIMKQQMNVIIAILTVLKTVNVPRMI